MSESRKAQAHTLSIRNSRATQHDASSFSSSSSSSSPKPPSFYRKLSSWIELFMYKHRNRLVYVHLFMFFFFLILVGAPLFLKAPQAESEIWNNFTTFSLFMIWGLWFPLVFLSVIFSGRSWCGLLCPMGAASQWVNQVGLKRPPPAWLRWEGTPVLSFVLITIFGQTLDVRDFSSGLAEIFLGTLVLALIIGFLFGSGGKKRAWCRHACPIGLLLGVFSRLSIVQFAPKQPQKTLPTGADQYAFHGVCPTFISINNKGESRHCIECFRCVKPSSPAGLTLKFRPPGEEIHNIASYNGNLTEVMFIFMSTGIALGGFLWLVLDSFQQYKRALGNWFFSHGLYSIATPGSPLLMSVHPAVHQSYTWLDFLSIVSYMFFWLILMLSSLSLCTSLSAWILNSPSLSFKKRFVKLGYQFAPIAMVSILLSLGDLLFSTFDKGEASHLAIEGIKIFILLLSFAWGMFFAWKLSNFEKVSKARRILSLLPSFVGALIVSISWYPALFGTGFSILNAYRHHLILLTH